MNYKLLENKENHYLVKHPDGSTFKVAKNGLKKDVQDKIESMQEVRGYADGGLVDEPNASYMPEDKIEDPTIGMKEATPAQSLYKQEYDRFKSGNVNMPEEYIQNMAAQSAVRPIERQEQAAKNEQFLSQQDQEAKKQEDIAYNERAAKLGLPLRPVPGEPQAQETPIPQQDTSAAPMAQPGIGEDPYSLYEKGIKGEAAAKSQMAREQEQTYKELQDKLNEGNRIHDARIDELHKENADLEQKVMNGKIDPNRMFNNMSTGSKLSAGIGIILGGIGQGLIGGQNEALKVINNAIDKDIDAQKQDIEKTQSLYKMNFEKLKDEKLAKDATKIQYMTLAELKLKQSMAKSASREAIANGQQALAQIQMAKQQLMQKSAVDQVVRMAQSNPELITPEIAQRLPKEDRERFVPGAGFALTTEGAKKIREEVKPDRDDAIAALDELGSLRKTYGREIMSREAVARADTLRGILRGKLRTFLVGPGAVTESEQKILNDIIQDPTAFLTTDAAANQRISSLRGAIDNSYRNKLRLNGLNISSQAQDSVNSGIKTMNGVPYQKVPGGWVPLKTGR